MSKAGSISDVAGGALAGAAAPPAAAHDADTGRVGPNAVIQLAAALRAQGHAALARDVFTECGHGAWLDAPPRDMVDERAVARLHQAVRAALPEVEARAVMREAGRRTADYLLANRIPKPVQAVLKLLPALPAAFILVAAIRKNAWTFAGSGQFAAHTGRPVIFDITGNPFCAGERAASPVCVWHEAVFERLFQALVAPRATARETVCEASGADVCRFEVAW